MVNGVSPVPSALLGAGFMIGCFGGGATIGGMYVVLQRRAAIKTAYELHLAHRKNARSTERVEQVEKARGFDRELMMAMTFHEVRNPLNGTVGHLRLAKRLVAGMRRGDAVGDGGGATEAPEASGDGGGGEAGGVYGEGGGAGSGALRALEEEVDLSIVATELAVQYLGTLAPNPSPSPSPSPSLTPTLTLIRYAGHAAWCAHRKPRAGASTYRADRAGPLGRL